MTVPKFNLRDLFWLTFVVAMGVCWWIDRRANNYGWYREQISGYMDEFDRLEAELEQCKKSSSGAK